MKILECRLNIKQTGNILRRKNTQKKEVQKSNFSNFLLTYIWSFKLSKLNHIIYPLLEIFFEKIKFIYEIFVIFLIKKLGYFFLYF
jgi:hypothetical protein